MARLHTLARVLWAERLTAIGLAGALAALIGIAQIYGPAAWIVGGLAAVGVAWRLGQHEEA